MKRNLHHVVLMEGHLGANLTELSLEQATYIGDKNTKDHTSHHIPLLNEEISTSRSSGEGLLHK